MGEDKGAVGIRASTLLSTFKEGSLDEASRVELSRSFCNIKCVRALVAPLGQGDCEVQVTVEVNRP